MNILSIILQQTGTMSGLSGLWPMLLIIAIFWLFLIRPQAKKQKEIKQYQQSIQKGDKIVTTGGIYGKVAEIHELYIIMESEGARLKVDKSAVLKDMTDTVAAK